MYLSPNEVTPFEYDQNVIYPYYKQYVGSTDCDYFCVVSLDSTDMLFTFSVVE